MFQSYLMDARADIALKYEYKSQPERINNLREEMVRVK